MVLLAELYRRLGEPRLAIWILRRVRKPHLISYVNATSLVTAAAIAWESGSKAQAHRYLERALTVAAPEGILRPFADLDDVLVDLFTNHAAWGTSHEGMLAAILGGTRNGGQRKEGIAVPLSAREREIFGYPCTTLTSDEIAATLHVSVNTIRTHQRSIYRKLGVNSRRAAIRFQL